MQELVRAADIEGFLEQGLPADEYDPEASELFEALHALPSDRIVATDLLPQLERIWHKSFSLSEEALATRRPHLLGLAKEIERFFGPESKPRTRADILSDTAAGRSAG